MIRLGWQWLQRLKLLSYCVPFLFGYRINVRVDEKSKFVNDICPMEPLSNVQGVTYIDQTNEKATGALIMLHGSCGTGYDFYETLQSLLGREVLFPHIKIIFPTAPNTSYAPLGGIKVPTWFDISGFTMQSNENENDVINVAKDLTKIVEREISCGIPLNRIVIAGFSRGGGMAFHMGFRFTRGIAGIGVMSSFLPDSSQVYKDLGVRDTTFPLPVLLQQHGTEDPLVSRNEGESTFTNLQSLGITGRFTTYKQGHEVTKTELQELYRFVNSLVPDNNY